MKYFLSFIVLSVLYAHSGFATGIPKSLKITEVSNPTNKKEKLLIIESEDSITLAEFDQMIRQYPELTRIDQSDDKAFKNVRVVAKTTAFIEKQYSTRDCLLGVGLCLGGMIIVQSAGSDLDTSNPPTGVYATVGNKYLDGGGACFVASMWTAGLVFGIKGIIEIFTKDNNYTGMIDNWSADDILNQTSLVKVDEKEFEIRDDHTIGKKVLPYVMVKTWL